MRRQFFGAMMSGSVSQSTLLDGLVSQWKLNNSAVDDIGGFDFTLGGGIGYSTGKVSDCLDADGVNDYARNTSGYNITGDSTISFSLNPDSVQPGFALCAGSKNYYTYSFNNNWNIQLLDPNQLRIVLATGNTTFVVATYPSTITSSVWQQVLVQIDSIAELCSVYIDNVLITSGSGVFATGGRTFGDLVNGLELFSASTVGAHLKGKIDCVKIWNRLLTSDEKLENYNSGNDVEL